MGKGIGFGKTILFGEHFVVYGLEGIPAALGDTTIAQVERIKGKIGYDLIDNRPATPGYKEEKKGEYDPLIRKVIEFMHVPEKLKITLSGNLFCASGVGASAACAVAIARAISDEYKMNWNDYQINKAAFEGETAGSGTPSGIDNTAATYGGFLYFKKNIAGGENQIIPVKVQKPIEIVLGNTGKTALTKEVVGAVKTQKESDPDAMQKIFDNYNLVVESAKKAIASYDLKKLGELMNQNQVLLRQINVSCKESEDIIQAAISAGALGSKVTGTGRGGLVICLTPGKELQEKVAKAIKQAGYEVTKTTIG
jgi:mevalonate kinase